MVSGILMILGELSIEEQAYMEMKQYERCIELSPGQTQRVSKHGEDIQACNTSSRRIPIESYS